ncbi:Rab8 family gtpase, partial [Globisporangium splendens]
MVQHSSKYDLLIKLLLIGDSGVGKSCVLLRYSDDSFTTSFITTIGGAMGILLVYDVTDDHSFQNIRNWMTQIKQNASSNVNKILIANKCDVDPSERVVSTKQGQDLANEFGIKFFETSAKNNLNIDEAFRSIAVDIQKRLAESEHDRLDVANGSKFRVDEQQDQSKDGCCN